MCYDNTFYLCIEMVLRSATVVSVSVVYLFSSMVLQGFVSMYGAMVLS